MWDGLGLVLEPLREGSPLQPGDVFVRVGAGAYKGFIGNLLVVVVVKAVALLVESADEEFDVVPRAVGHLVADRLRLSRLCRITYACAEQAEFVPDQSLLPVPVVVWWQDRADAPDARAR